MTSAFAATLLAWWLAIGPNGVVLTPALAPAAVLAEVPPPALGETAATLWVVLHDVDDWPRAFFQRRGAPPMSASSARRARLLPALAVPRLFLYAPYYYASYDRPGAAPLAVTALPVDTASALYAALLEARLARLVEGGPPAVAAWLAVTAEARMADLPPAARGAALRGAVVDFAATLLGVANEIARSETRRRARGDSLCRLLDDPRTLFRRWRDVFASPSFRGLYGDGRASREGLSAADKAWVVEHLLGVPWRGDPWADFAGLCRPSAVERHR